MAASLRVAFPIGYVVNVVGGIVVAAFGVWVASVRPRARTNVIFAVWAVAFGLAFALSNAPFLVGISPDEFFSKNGLTFAIGLAMMAFFLLATFLFVALGFRLPRALPAEERRLLALPACVLIFTMLLVTGADLMDARYGDAFVDAIFSGLVGSLWATVLLLGLRTRFDPSLDERSRRQAMLLAAAILVFVAPISGTLALGGPDPISAEPGSILLGSLGLASSLLVAVVWLRVPPGADVRLSRAVAWLALGGALAGMLLNVVAGGAVASDALGVAGIARVLMTAILAYAILRHQLFDLDLKVKWTIRRGTVAASFVAVFFVASQLAQNYLSESQGWALGGVVAGLLLFGIAPLQRMAERVANVAMPHVHDPVRRGTHEDAVAYRAAVEMALSDGVVTRQEEKALARLAERLGIGSEDAWGIREEVEREVNDRAAAPRGAP